MDTLLTRPKTKHLPRFPITMLEPCREFYHHRLPGLGHNPAYWRMLQLLLHPPRDAAGKGWYIGYDVVASISGGKQSAIEFLTAFQRDVLPGFKFSEYTKGRSARKVISTGLDQFDKDFFALSKAVRKARPGEYLRVYMHDGSRFSRSKAAEFARKIDNAMRRDADTTNDHIQALILRYHVDLPAIMFRRLIYKNEAKARHFIDSQAHLSDDDRERLHRQLNQIVEYPKPRYHISGQKTKRLYPMPGCANLTSIKREIRWILTAGCWEIDLWACHLAVISRDWGIPELRTLLTDLLHAGKKPWAFFAEQMGETLTPDLKETMKQAIYMLCYGASQRNIKITMDSYRAGLGTVFLGLPIMRIILQARKRVMEERRIKTEWDIEHGVDTLVNMEILDHGAVRSMLSCTAQGFEQILVGEVYMMAAKYPEMTILVYSFDGVTVGFRDNIPYRTEPILREIKAAVDLKAAELGIPTTIEIEQVPD